MAPRTCTPIDALAAPPGDGEILIWPEAARLPHLVDENRRRLSTARALLLDRPLSNWGVSSRGSPLIFTGHQPAFLHPGVWAKNVVATELAKRVGGDAVFLAVDSDSPDRLALEWPRRIGDHYETASAALLQSVQGRCYEQFPPFSSADCEDFSAQLDPGMTSDATPFAAFHKAFCRPESDRADYVSRWTSGMNALDRAVGAAAPLIERISDRFACDRASCDPSAVALVAHVLLKAESFAVAYNSALAEYRAARGIKGDRHPIPDLLVTPERVELPFWILDPTGARQRLLVTKNSSQRDAVELWAGAASIASVPRKNLLDDPPAALRDIGSPQIRPRALALTIYARLLACDLFIHGIGGAKYDQITDNVIRRFFGIEAPPYACVSATMRLPLHRHPVTRNDEYLCRHRLRDLRHNPQRYLNGADGSPSVATMIGQREQAILQSDRLRAENRKDHAARRDAYHAIRRLNRALVATTDELAKEFQREAAVVASALKQNQIVDNREWFVGLYPTSRLIELRKKLVGMVF